MDTSFAVAGNTVETRDGRFGSMNQMYWNLIWKSPGFVPFGANMTNFGGKPTILGSVLESWLKPIYRDTFSYMNWVIPASSIHQLSHSSKFYSFNRLNQKLLTMLHRGTTLLCIKLSRHHTLKFRHDSFGNKMFQIGTKWNKSVRESVSPSVVVLNKNNNRIYL